MEDHLTGGTASLNRDFLFCILVLCTQVKMMFVVVL